MQKYADLQASDNFPSDHCQVIFQRLMPSTRLSHLVLRADRYLLLPLHFQGILLRVPLRHSAGDPPSMGAGMPGLTIGWEERYSKFFTSAAVPIEICVYFYFLSLAILNRTFRRWREHEQSGFCTLMADMLQRE